MLLSIVTENVLQSDFIDPCFDRSLKCKVSYKRTAPGGAALLPSRPIVSESLVILVINWCFVLSRSGETCLESRGGH